MTGANVALAVPPTSWVGDSAIGELGIFGFECSQLAGEHVEIAIEQLGCVELVIQPVVMGDLPAEFGDPFADGGRLRGLRHRNRV